MRCVLALLLPAEASLHPSPANKASAAPVPPLALTHRLTQPKPSAAPHLHFLTYKPGPIPAVLPLSYIRQPGARANPAALCNP